MLDDFQDISNSAAFLDELEEEEKAGHEEIFETSRRPARRILGMTAAQRFVITLMLFFSVCILGTFGLLVLERIAPPFL